MQKGEKINVARIRNLECYSEDDLVQLNDNWDKYNKKKNTVSRHTVCTGSESIMRIVICISIEESDAANEIAGEFLASAINILKEYISFQGEVMGKQMPYWSVIRYNPKEGYEDEFLKRTTELNL